MERRLAARMALFEDPLRGDIQQAYWGHSANRAVYDAGQSGGLVSETLEYLLESKRITAALVVRLRPGPRPRPEWAWVNSVQGVRSAQGSVYGPLNTLSALGEIAQDSAVRLAIVCLPCQVQALELLKQVSPGLVDKIVIKLGLLCDRALSVRFVDYAISVCQATGESYRFRYRDKSVAPNHMGDAALYGEHGTVWRIPGFHRFGLKDALTPPRCYACLDKLNVLADLCFGDAWGIEGGNADRGDSVVLVRSAAGHEILKGLQTSGRVQLQAIAPDDAIRGQNVELKMSTVNAAQAVFARRRWVFPQFLKHTLNDRRPDGEDVARIGRYIRMYLFHRSMPGAISMRALRRHVLRPPTMWSVGRRFLGTLWKWLQVFCGMRRKKTARTR